MRSVEQDLEVLRQKIANQDACLDRQYQVQERQKIQYATLLESFNHQKRQIDSLAALVSELQEKVNKFNGNILDK